MTDETGGHEPALEPQHHARQSLVLPVAIPLGSLVAIGLVLFGFSRVLLSVSAHAATAVALVVALAIMATATIVASRERLSNGTLFSMVGAVAGVAMLAGGIAIVAIGKGEEGAQPQVVALAAPKGAATSGFDPTTLSVEADKPIELQFANQDPGVQHNVVIFAQDPTKNPDATALFTGDLTTGLEITTYPVPPLHSGTYFFHCAVHPGTMTGTIDAGAAAGAGGGGLTVTAQGLAFNTDTLDLTAGQPTTFTFDNEDAGVPHNLSIYTDASAAKTLFHFDPFPGVDSRSFDIPPLDPGTYYFHCDVHPDMNGTVVVAPGPGGGPGNPSGSPPGATGATGASPSG